MTHSVGNGVNVAAMLFVMAGVAVMMALEASGAGLTVEVMPEPDKRRTSGPPFVLGRYQKLSV